MADNDKIDTTRNQGGNIDINNLHYTPPSNTSNMVTESNNQGTEMKRSRSWYLHFFNWFFR
jgi:hypothetical protein